MCNLYRMTKNKDEVAKWFDLILITAISLSIYSE